MFPLLPQVAGCFWVTIPYGGPLAQWLEHPAHNWMVLGSNPRGPTKSAAGNERQALALRVPGESVAGGAASLFEFFAGDSRLLNPEEESDFAVVTGGGRRVRISG